MIPPVPHSTSSTYFQLVLADPCASFCQKLLDDLLHDRLILGLTLAHSALPVFTLFGILLLLAEPVFDFFLSASRLAFVILALVIACDAQDHSAPPQCEGGAFDGITRFVPVFPPPAAFSRRPIFAGASFRPIFVFWAAPVARIALSCFIISDG